MQGRMAWKENMTKLMTKLEIFHNYEAVWHLEDASHRRLSSISHQHRKSFFFICVCMIQRHSYIFCQEEAPLDNERRIFNDFERGSSSAVCNLSQKRAEVTLKT